jgi:DNA-binding transcriptional LysR family regulator
MRPFDIPDIRARELLTVIALSEYGSFVAAAAYLKTSQPALTRTVKRLERVLGVTLFFRNTRRVEITAAGRELVTAAERILGDLEVTARGLSEVPKEQRGRVTLSTHSAFAGNELPQLVRKFRDSRPAIEVRIREGRQTEIIEDVRSGLSDFGIGPIDSLPDTLTSELLLREPLYAVYPTTHQFSAKKKVRLEDLREETLISGPVDTMLRRLVDGAASNAGISLRYGVTVERLMSILGHVRAGVGIAVVPEGVLPPKPWKEFEATALSEPALMLSFGRIVAADLDSGHPRAALARFSNQINHFRACRFWHAR